MKHALLALLVLLSAPSTFAVENFFRCTNVRTGRSIDFVYETQSRGLQLLALPSMETSCRPDARFSPYKNTGTAYLYDIPFESGAGVKRFRVALWNQSPVRLQVEGADGKRADLECDYLPFENASEMAEYLRRIKRDCGYRPARI